MTLSAFGKGELLSKPLFYRFSHCFSFFIVVRVSFVKVGSELFLVCIPSPVVYPYINSVCFLSGKGYTSPTLFPTILCHMSYVSFVRCFLGLVWFSFLTIIIDFRCVHRGVSPFFFSLSLSLKKLFLECPLFTILQMYCYFFPNSDPMCYSFYCCVRYCVQN